MSTDRSSSDDRPTFIAEETRVDQPAVLPSLESSSVPARLEQLAGPGAPRRFPLDLDEIVVGRSLQAHVAIDSSSISRRHLRIHREGAEYVMTDLESANGVYLNGVKAHSAILREGDQLQIGDVIFRYREGH